MRPNDGYPSGGKPIDPSRIKLPTCPAPGAPINGADPWLYEDERPDVSVAWMLAAGVVGALGMLVVLRACWRMADALWSRHVDLRRA